MSYGESRTDFDSGAYVIVYLYIKQVDAHNPDGNVIFSGDQTPDNLNAARDAAEQWKAEPKVYSGTYTGWGYGTYVKRYFTGPARIYVSAAGAVRILDSGNLMEDSNGSTGLNWIKQENK